MQYDRTEESSGGEKALQGWNLEEYSQKEGNRGKGKRTGKSWQVESGSRASGGKAQASEPVTETSLCRSGHRKEAAGTLLKTNSVNAPRVVMAIFISLPVGDK